MNYSCFNVLLLGLSASVYKKMGSGLNCEENINLRIIFFGRLNAIYIYIYIRIFWLFGFLLYVAFSGAEGGHIGAGLPDKEREEKTEEAEQTRSREKIKKRSGLAWPRHWSQKVDVCRLTFRRKYLLKGRISDDSCLIHSC